MVPPLEPHPKMQMAAIKPCDDHPLGQWPGMNGPWAHLQVVIGDARPVMVSAKRGHKPAAERIIQTKATGHSQSSSDMASALSHWQPQQRHVPHLHQQNPCMNNGAGCHGNTLVRYSNCTSGNPKQPAQWMHVRQQPPYQDQYFDWNELIMEDTPTNIVVSYETLVVVVQLSSPLSLLIMYLSFPVWSVISDAFWFHDFANCHATIVVPFVDSHEKPSATHTTNQHCSWLTFVAIACISCNPWFFYMTGINNQLLIINHHVNVLQEVDRLCLWSISDWEFPALLVGNMYLPCIIVIHG